MGPILAVGLYVGVNDLPNLRKAVRHFAVMTLVALGTSTLYFLITPLGDVQSELLARTRPTLLDAAIAVFGGLAGIIGVSRRERGNVVPGVAIATALMPPLCTAGFGIANGNWPFFFGAIYLFALNSIFIATATVSVVRYLGFPFVEYLDDSTRRKIRLQMAAFVLVILVPSTWVLVGVVQESLFHRRAREFIEANLGSLAGADIVNERIMYGDSVSVIEIFMAGESLPPMLTEQLQARMASAGLANTVLRIHQPEDVAGELGRLSGELRVGIVEDMYQRQAVLLSERDQRIQDLEAALSAVTADTVPVEQITREVAVQYPLVERLSFGRVVQARPAGPGDDAGALWVLDTIPTVVLGWRSGSSAAARARERTMLEEWLRVRLQLDTVQVIGG
jgi:uncharacterized membrane protein